MSTSLFTKIINRDIPADIVHEDDLCIAFKDIHPVAPMHLLIVPKEHIATINDLTHAHKDLVGHLHIVAAKLAADAGYRDSGYRLVWNCNEHGGQTVFHIHLHLIAGKAFGWPPYTDQLKQP